MKSLHYLIVAGLFFLCFSLKAEERVYERVYVHTDKDCYIAGEDILMKFYVTNSHFQPSSLSKVGYVEICDTEKPRMQVKLALDEGRGAGMIQIPADLPSGIYRLTGYTRYMRNEGEPAFFNRPVAIVNVAQQTPDIKRWTAVKNYDDLPPVKNESSGDNQTIGLSIKTDRNDYGNRKKVLLALDHIPDNAADLVISVYRDDSIVRMPEINRQEWVKQVTDTFPFSGQWIPEYEGAIIAGRFNPEPKEPLLSNLAFVGNDIRYFQGQASDSTGTVRFYTSGIYGKQQIVTTATSILYMNVPYRIDLLTPFCESLPDSLPALPVYPNEKRLIERYIGVQIHEKTDSDSLSSPIQPSDDHNFKPVSSYDLDQYTRFSTLSETILEFVDRVRVAKIGNKQRIRVFMGEELTFNQGNTLVLLDGIPVYDHEAILNYNPMYIKRINIYDQSYQFGGNHFESIVSFTTHEGNLPFFQLSDGAQMFNYDGPQLPPPFESPDYSTAESLNSRKPDFRHTLYWNPSVPLTPGQPVDLSFYTSDLCGAFKIDVEGITTDGKMIHGASYFRVRAK